jgi:integrase
VYRYFDEMHRRKAVRIGTIEQYPNEAVATKAAEAFRLAANPECPTAQAVTFAAVVGQYLREELPSRKSTRTFYRPWIKNYILPRWGNWSLAELARSPFAVEQWLKGLALAPKSKVHIRSLMHVMFNCAMRWGLMSNQPNAMSLVRIKDASKRKKQPKILTAEQCIALLTKIPEPFKTMVLVAMCLGLRVSEIVGLKWGDLDWELLQASVRRSVVLGSEGEVKTVYSARQMPLDAGLAEILFRHKQAYAAELNASDWIFPNPKTGKPWWPHQIQQQYIRKTGIAVLGLDGIGWHTFRHTYSSMLRANGTDVKVQQELLRHADIRTTLNIYTQALPQQLREANSQVVRMVLGAGKAARDSN